MLVLIADKTVVEEEAAVVNRAHSLEQVLCAIQWKILFTRKVEVVLWVLIVQLQQLVLLVV